MAEDSEGGQAAGRRPGSRTCPSEVYRPGQGLMPIDRVRLPCFALTHDQDWAFRATEELHRVAACPEQPEFREPSTTGDYEAHAELFGQAKNLVGGVALPVVRARDDPAHLLDLPHLLVEQGQGSEPFALEEVFGYIVKTGLGERIAFTDFYPAASPPGPTGAAIEISSTGRRCCWPG